MRFDDGVHVVHQQAFGQLQLQAFGARAVGLQRIHHVLHEIGVLELA
jgi:hypothetical protein